MLRTPVSSARKSFDRELQGVVIRAMQKSQLLSFVVCSMIRCFSHIWKLEKHQTNNTHWYTSKTVGKFVTFVTVVHALQLFAWASTLHVVWWLVCGSGPAGCNVNTNSECSNRKLVQFHHSFPITTIPASRVVGRKQRSHHRSNLSGKAIQKSAATTSAIHLPSSMGSLQLSCNDRSEVSQTPKFVCITHSIVSNVQYSL